jgi:hypothetical protein
MNEVLLVQAAPAIEEISHLEPDELFAELEIRRRAIASDPQLAGSFDMTSEYRSVVSENLDVLRRMGKSFFAGFSRDAYQLVCGDDKDSATTRTQILRAITDHASVSTLLAAAAVFYWGCSPALATVGAVLVSKLILKNAKGAVCEEWRKSLS